MSINISSTPFTLPTTVQLPPAPVGTVVVSTYSFQSSDAQCYTVFNSTAAQVATISSGVFQIGSLLTGEQAGAGALTVIGGSAAVTINQSTVGIAFARQTATVGFFQRALDVWTAWGNTA